MTNVTLVLRDNLRDLMERRGWSQHVTAAKSHVAQTTISNILRYRDAQDKHPGTDTLERLARAFDLPAWRLLLPPNTLIPRIEEPDPLDVELLSTALIEAADLFRAHNTLPTPELLSTAAVQMYDMVMTGIPLRRAAETVSRRLDQIRSGTLLASPPKSGDTEGVNRGRRKKGATRRGKT